MRLSRGILHINAFLLNIAKKEGVNLVFYDNLKAECDKQKIKITPLIQKCGGSTGTISNWRKGASPNSDIVMKIAMQLNVSTDYLLFGHDKKDNEISIEEKKLLTAFRKLTPEGQNAVLMFAEVSAQNPQYQKYTDIPKEA